MVYSNNLLSSGHELLIHLPFYHLDDDSFAHVIYEFIHGDELYMILSVLVLLALTQSLLTISQALVLI